MWEITPAMMDPAVKTALAFCVLLAGVCAAMLFHHDRPRPATPDPNAEEELLLRYRVDAGVRPKGAGRSTRALQSDLEATASPRPATIVTPLDRHEPPPSLAPDYPKTDRPASSRWGTSMEMMLPITTPTDATARTHKVVDGDTLTALAERYLGAAARAQEIYEANRDVLHDPKLLPIGVELKLPPRNSRSAPPRPLAPVR
jgi:nucleoid-associated protein YgaU